jgi:hypothetical protein
MRETIGNRNERAAMIPPSSPKHRATTINALGLLILLLGMGSAWFVFQGGEKALRHSEATDWQDDTLSARDSKLARYQLEKQIGPVGVLMANLWEDMTQPGAVALLILVASTAAACGCFLVSRYYANLDSRMQAGEEEE